MVKNCESDTSDARVIIDSGMRSAGVLQTKHIIDDFEAFIQRPENADRLVELMWEVYFRSKTIDDVLDVDDVIPGFTLAVKKVFGAE